MPDINMQVFGEVQRNQLVTEVDIQTQVALDDYQVQLSDIANPTQSQDNIVIDRFGEFLSHWNESLDFDTWVKMSMEIAGKRILMLRGNSSGSGRSSISDTFIFGDGFEDDDYTQYTILGAGTWVESSGILSQTAGFTGVSAKAVIEIIESDYILEVNFRPDDLSGDNNLAGLCAKNVVATNLGYTGGIMYNDLTKMEVLNEGVAHGTPVATGFTFTVGTWYNMKMQIAGNTQKSKAWVQGNSEPSWQGQETYTTHSGTFVGMDGGHGSPSSKFSFNNFRVRKYTATEPMWGADGKEQNIIVALKSLGRVG